MPSLISQLVANLGGALDEKAQGSLQKDVDPVQALSILHRLTEKGSEVRNASAFVATAVKAAITQVSAGPGELESAMRRLISEGILDDKSADALRSGNPVDASGALQALLSQDVASVRNASAYVTRSMANARDGKGKSGGCGMMGGGPMGKGGGPMGMGGMGMGGGMMMGGPGGPLGKWGSILDNKAQDSLMALGPGAAMRILEEMESKGDVRNPSAYVQKACDNWTRGQTPAGAEKGGGGGMKGMGGGMMGMDMMGMGGMGGMGGGMGGGMDGGMGARLGAYQGILDQSALDALAKLGPDQAGHILENLEGKASTVRNPSAYVVRSVANLISGGPGDGGGGGGGGGGGSGYNSPGMGQPPPGQLDDRALSALTELDPAEQAAIMEQLESKRGQIQNPSAYVLRACSNARKGCGKGAGGGGPPPMAGGFGGGGGGGGFPAPGMGMGMGMGMGGMDMGMGMGGVPSLKLDSWRLRLDGEAVKGLEGLGGEAADSILSELESKGDSVRNPSAYVNRAVSNARMGGGRAGEMQRRETNAFAGMQLQEEMAKFAGQIDEKAISALTSVSAESALAILKALQNVTAPVNNPNAYIMRAVSNEKQGAIYGKGGGGGQFGEPPDAKRYKGGW